MWSLFRRHVFLAASRARLIDATAEAILKRGIALKHWSAEEV